MNQWPPTTSTYVYYLNGDSTIGGVEYHKLYSRGLTMGFGPLPINTFDGFTGYLLRQDNRSIRFWSTQIETDSLLVSYEYQLGDTVRGDIFQTNHNESTIQKIDSVLVNSEYRRVLYIDSIFGPVITEGIGHQNEINNESGEFIHKLIQGIGFEWSIECFGYGLTPYWDPQGTGGNCYLNVGVEEIDLMESNVYPNPFNDNLFVDTNSNSETEIEVFDIYGRSIIRSTFSKSIKIPTEYFENGIYIYKMKRDRVVTQSGVVVKAN
jgi:hypothetical protein